MRVKTFPDFPEFFHILPMPVPPLFCLPPYLTKISRRTGRAAGIPRDHPLPYRSGEVPNTLRTASR